MPDVIPCPRVYLPRFSYLARILNREGIELASSSVLDLGARRMEIRGQFSPARYLAIDFDPGLPPQPHLRHHDLEQDLPAELAADVVIALDVLEHLESFHRRLAQIRDLAGKHAILALPNMYHYLHRLRFVRGCSLGAKYALGPVRLPDRHRWIFTLAEAVSLLTATFPADSWRLSFHGQRPSYRHWWAKAVDASLPLGADSTCFTLFAIASRR